MNLRRLGIGFGILALLMFAATPVYACIPPPPPPPCGEGCTPGFWKNHDWPSLPLPPVVGEWFAEAPPQLAGDSFMEALRYKGGGGYLGAARILLRAGVAAILNAISPDVNYPYGAMQVVGAVNAALASGDRSMILAWAGFIDYTNNLGCPM